MEDALSAAAAAAVDGKMQAGIGDMRPVTFTHDTSAQRVAGSDDGIGSNCMADSSPTGARDLRPFS